VVFAIIDFCEILLGLGIDCPVSTRIEILVFIIETIDFREEASEACFLELSWGAGLSFSM
jgi:hypothetical protein